MYDIQPENAMAFHLRYWERAVRNGSAEYNYAEWNRDSRQDAARHIKNDTRRQPRPEEHVDLDPQVRIICPAGGIIIFSGAHLHSTVPNSSGVTRFSIDFRTVHLEDVRRGAGAVNVDSACTGTTMGDYLRGSDSSHLPDDVISESEPGNALSLVKGVASGAGVGAV
jgi:hypothetical protein